jgi:hypothetical protein
MKTCRLAEIRKTILYLYSTAAAEGRRKMNGRQNRVEAKVLKPEMKADCFLKPNCLNTGVYEDF